MPKPYIPRIFGFKIYGKQGSKFRGQVGKKEEEALPVLRESSSQIAAGGEGKKKKKNKKAKHESSVTSPVKK